MSIKATAWFEPMKCETVVSLTAPGTGCMVIRFNSFKSSSPQVICGVAASLYGELFEWVNPKEKSVAHMTGDQAEQTINYLKGAN